MWWISLADCEEPLDRKVQRGVYPWELLGRWKDRELVGVMRVVGVLGGGDFWNFGHLLNCGGFF